MASSLATCQTACEKAQFAEIYTCKTEKHTKDPCSPKGYATDGKRCAYTCKFSAGYGYTTCWVPTATSYVQERCSMY